MQSLVFDWRDEPVRQRLLASICSRSRGLRSPATICSTWLQSSTRGGRRSRRGTEEPIMGLRQRYRRSTSQPAKRFSSTRRRTVLTLQRRVAMWAW